MDFPQEGPHAIFESIEIAAKHNRNIYVMKLSNEPMMVVSRFKDYREGVKIQLSESEILVFRESMLGLRSWEAHFICQIKALNLGLSF